jgi:hypothetical protein
VSDAKAVDDVGAPADAFSPTDGALALDAMGLDAEAALDGALPDAVALPDAAAARTLSTPIDANNTA